MNNEVKFLECVCKDNSHLVVIKCETWDNNSPEIHIGYQLNSYLPWYKRIVHAVRYVFGKRNDESAWDTTILTEDGIQELEIVLKEYKKSKKVVDRKQKLSAEKGMKF